jgi:hypothetical protein
MPHNTKKSTVAWVLNSLNKPAFPISPQHSLLNNRQEKQPAYYERQYYKPLEWKSYQNWHELDDSLRQQLIKKWHADNRIEGVSTLGGWNGQHWLCWIDFDAKDFANSQEMENAIAQWLDRYPIIKNAPHFTTPSGGHRFLVALNREPDGFGANNGFTLKENSSQRAGELLTRNGGHTLLPPTLGANGKQYEWLHFVEYPPIVNSPADIGIYPLAKPQKQTQTKTEFKNNSSNYERFLNEFSLPVGTTIPLSISLAPSTRQLIERGESQGSRDNTAAKVARDLIGTADYLNNIGQQFEGNARSLLEEFCSRCSPPIGDRDVDRIWRSALKSNPSPSLGEEEIKGCIAAHLWREEKAEGTKESAFSTAAFQRSKQEKQELSSKTIYQQLVNLHQQNLKSDILHFKLKELSKQCDWTLSELLGQYRLIAECYNETERVELEIERFKDRPKQSEEFFDLTSVLPEFLANALIQKGKSLRTEPARFLQHFFPKLGAILGAKFGIEIEKENGDKWREYPIFYCADVATPSGGKTTAFNAIWSYLKKHQIEEFERHRNLLERYQTIKEAWSELSAHEKDERNDTEENPRVFKANHLEEFTKRTWIFDNATVEAVLYNLSQQLPLSGSCWTSDELSGLFSGLNQYKGGKGNDRQTLLEGWNAPLTTSIARKSVEASFFLNYQTLNITGGFQLKVIRKHLNLAEDEDGLVSRFLFCIPKDDPDFDVWTEEGFDLYPLMRLIFQCLENYPSATDDDGKRLTTFIGLTPQARRYFIKKWEQIRGKIKAIKSKDSVLASYLGKLLSYSLRFALVLHILDWMFMSNPPATIGDCSVSAMERAFKLVDYYEEQFLLVQDQTDKTSHKFLEGFLKDVYELARSSPGQTVTTREVCRKFNRRKIDGKPINAAIALNTFQALVDTGYGSLTNKSYCAAVINDDRDDKHDDNAKPLSNNGFKDLSSPSSIIASVFEDTQIEMVVKTVEKSDDSDDKSIEPLPDIGLDAMTDVMTNDDSNDKAMSEPTFKKGDRVKHVLSGLKGTIAKQVENSVVEAYLVKWDYNHAVVEIPIELLDKSS